MTAFTQTVTNQLGLVGLGFPCYWGTIVWGTDKWGSDAPAFAISHAYVSTMTVSSGEVLSAKFDRVLANTMTVSSAEQLSAVFDRTITNQIDLDSMVGKDAQRNISNDLSLDSDPSLVLVSQGVWNRIFPDDTINALAAYVPTYVAASAAATSWTTGTKPTTTWS